MSFLVFDYRCTWCGEYDTNRFVRSSESDDQMCECGGKLKKLLSAPRLDIAGMAKAGCPGAYETIGNKIEKQHTAVDQHHRRGTGHRRG